MSFCITRRPREGPNSLYSVREHYLLICITNEYTLIVRTREPWRGPRLLLQCVQQYKSNSTGEPLRGKRPPTSRTKRPEKGDELTYYLKRGRVDYYYLQRVQESPREARGPLQVVLCGLQPKSASESRHLAGIPSV